MRRHVMLGAASQQNRGGLLPSGYTKLEYIESTGTQYIDTGIVPTKNIGIRGKACYTAVANSQSIIGYRTNAGDTRFWLNESIGLFRPSMGGYIDSSVPVVPNETKDFSFNYNNDLKAYWGDESENLTYLGTVWQDSLYVFCANVYGSPDYFAHLKLYYLAIYNGNSLVRNLIPCCLNSDNILGMYDTVSQTFFTNAGTGPFIAGPEVPLPLV